MANGGYHIINLENVFVPTFNRQTGTFDETNIDLPIEEGRKFYEAVKHNKPCLINFKIKEVFGKALREYKYNTFLAFTTLWNADPEDVEKGLDSEKACGGYVACLNNLYKNNTYFSISFNYSTEYTDEDGYYYPEEFVVAFSIQNL